MEFLKLLFKRSKVFYFSVALLSIINSLLNIGLLLMVNNTINGHRITWLHGYEWAAFLTLVLLSIISSCAFQVHMIRLTTEVNFDFELNILRKVKQAYYPDLLQLGNERIITAVNDVRALVNLPEVLTNAINAVITVVCCFAYLFYISWPGGTLILGLMLLLLLLYIVRNKHIEKDLNHVRTLQTHYYRFLGDLLMGFKEIRIDGARSRNIYDRFFLRNRSEARLLSRKANTRYMINEIIGHYSWYIVIGVTLFVMPLLVRTDVAFISSFLVTILYLMGPVAVLITLIPTYTNVRIALQRLSEFNNIIDSSLSADHTQQEHLVDTGLASAEFESISFRDIVYEYTDVKHNKTFTLGPVSLDIHRGEIVFIRGGNGSGKSTFVNILTGLYKPASGSIYLNGTLLPKEQTPVIHRLVAAVFASPYLFTENYNDFNITPQNELLQQLLLQLGLSDKARFEHNNINPNLSKGQQKRLAIIMALLEEKPILVLDEWAADQDPVYRKYFYDTLLPDLRGKGKTIVAITHDDQYFYNCNRLIRFDYGTIKEDTVINQVTSLQSQPL
ncbi:cyclic peptide export ABC transporter [Chitinophaga qingshengii]|uniref:Cyclic peptide export ABC transporter n=1 Tax=Chitinophaga qingshengii TaxID=1569794 RepID=A0ABR7TWN3_9BACT|nr:cyclic peptide export ABC transporter [Chitinophaga qingshengii]MBC9934897.1 cyclic peptide export ABC transporter [Chitinophaga qingshengii]